MTGRPNGPAKDAAAAPRSPDSDSAPPSPHDPDPSLASGRSHAEPAARRRERNLEQRLRVAGRRLFVGRHPERALFARALRAAEPPFALLHLHGPGGVGKSALLDEFAREAQRRGARALRLDGRDLDPTPAGFWAALCAALEVDDADAAHKALTAPPRTLLLLDTYERLTPLDGWLRRVFLPQLPARTLAVFAGRNPPSAVWRADPAWRELLQPLSLRNLRPDESRAYLHRSGVAAALHRPVLAFTHGHPLALSLVADVLRQRQQPLSFRPEAVPDVVQALLERFLEAVPSAAQRAALEACALVRATTEPLLAAMLHVDDAHEIFAWLRTLSFIECGAQGLFPHDEAREVLDADLRWRNPERYALLHRRARAYYTRRLSLTRGAEQQRLLFDDVFLHRHNPMVEPYLAWGEIGSVYGEPARPDEQPALLAMIARHEGTEAAVAAGRWLQRPAAGLTVYRDAGGEPAGLLLRLALERASAGEIEADPASRAAWRYAQRYGPARAGEGVTLFRSWMARDAYQGVGAVQSAIFLDAVQHYIGSPRLAWSFFPCADPEFWFPAFSYMAIYRAPEADFELGGRRYGVFAHDWRVMPVPAWLDLLGQRELLTDLDPAALAAERPAPLLVLSEPDFQRAVRAALRAFGRPAELADNPLLRSRLLAGHGAPDPATLQALLRDAAELLSAHPRDAKGYRALRHTYLEPAASQELAAELLGLPFSTYRRHLKAGVERLTEILWRGELNGGS